MLEAIGGSGFYAFITSTRRAQCPSLLRSLLRATHLDPATLILLILPGGRRAVTRELAQVVRRPVEHGA